MRQSKLSSTTKLLCCVFATFSCVHPTIDGIADKDVGTALNRTSYAFLSSAMGAPDHEQSLPLALKNHFCAADKSRGSLVQKIVSKSPSVVGLDLESGQEVKANFTIKARLYAKSFFAVTGVTDGETDYTYNAKKLFGWKALRFSKSFSISLYDHEEFDTEAPKCHLDPDKNADLRFVAFPLQGLVYIVPERTYWHIEDGFWEAMGGSQVQHADHFTFQAETTALVHNFSLMGPPGLLHNYANNISIKDAVSQQKLLWAAYLMAFTSVKESPGKNPDDTAFEVSLDLSGFCKYGRAINDLIAK